MTSTNPGLAIGNPGEGVVNSQVANRKSLQIGVAEGRKDGRQIIATPFDPPQEGGVTLLKVTLLRVTAKTCPKLPHGIKACISTLKGGRGQWTVYFPASRLKMNGLFLLIHFVLEYI